MKAITPIIAIPITDILILSKSSSLPGFFVSFNNLFTFLKKAEISIIYTFGLRVANLV